MTRRLSLVTATILLALATPAEADAVAVDRGCVADPATRIPTPTTTPGVCVGSVGQSLAIVQKVEAGLLIVNPKGHFALEPNRDGTRSIHVYEGDSRLVFCPNDTLDPKTGFPMPSCLSAFGSRSAGSGAYVGDGRVLADLVADTDGAARCPASVQVVGSVAGPAGQEFDLRGALLLTRTLGPGSGCLDVQQEVRLRPAGYYLDSGTSASVDESGLLTDRSLSDLQNAMDQIKDIDLDQWRMIDLLVSLTDEEWRLLKQLLALSPEEIEALLIGGGKPSEPGKPGGKPDDYLGDGTPGEDKRFSPEAFLQTILSRVNNIRSTVNRMNGVLPDKPDIRNLFNDVGLSRVTSTLDQVRESFVKLQDTIAILRDGIEGFDETAMRDSVNVWLDDLEELWLLPQQLACFDDSSRPLRELKTDLLRDLIDALPKAALFAFQKLLDEFQPEWRTSLQDILDRAPTALREGICDESTASAATFEHVATGPRHIDEHDRMQPRNVYAGSGDAERNACEVLRDETIGFELRRLQPLSRLTANLYGLIGDFTKDKQNFQLTINIVGGGGAGWSVMLPAKPTLKTIERLLNGLSWRIGNLIARRNACLAKDDRLERDLLSCTATASNVIDVSTSIEDSDVYELASRKATEMIDLGLRDSADRLFIDSATTFDELCLAYRDFVSDN